MILAECFHAHLDFGGRGEVFLVLFHEEENDSEIKVFPEDDDEFIITTKGQS